MNMKILNKTIKKDKKFGSYFTTIAAEPYSVGKHHFLPQYRSIYISSEMYTGTKRSFYYVTSHIQGSMRLYRCKTWHDTEVANIFASGKTLQEAIKKFEYNYTNKIYNVR